MSPVAASALWLALVAVEVAAVALAGRLGPITGRTIPGPSASGSEDIGRSPRGNRLKIFQSFASWRNCWRSSDRRRLPGGLLFVLLAFALADELAVEALHVLVFERAPRPFAGWVRAAYHVETAIVTGWPALLAATCWRVFGPPLSSMGTPNIAEGKTGKPACFGRETTKLQKRSILQFGDLLGASWIGLVIGLAALYPLDAPGSGAPRTRAVLHTWEVLCVAATWWGVWRGRARRWGRVEEALVIVAACETMVALVGPWASDPFTRWWIGRVFYLAAWSALCVVLARPARSV